MIEVMMDNRPYLRVKFHPEDFFSPISHTQLELKQIVEELQNEIIKQMEYTMNYELNQNLKENYTVRIDKDYSDENMFRLSIWVTNDVSQFSGKIIFTSKFDFTNTNSFLLPQLVFFGEDVESVKQAIVSGIQKTLTDHGLAVGYGA